MSETLEIMLRSLRDVDGVVGSFVLHQGGELAARDLPEYFDAGALLEVGPRVERLYDAWKSLDAELETASLVFADHRLHVRDVGGAYLAVVSSAEANAPALRMAMGMVSRRVHAAFSARTSAPPAAAERSAPQQPPAPDPRAARSSQPAGEPALDAPKPRVYRGNVVR